MSYIESIQNAENKARKMVQKAEKQAQDNIEEAKKHKEITLQELEEQLKKQQREELNAQKDNLKKIYVKITEEGEVERKNLQRMLDNNRPAAIKLVIDKLFSY